MTRREQAQIADVFLAQTRERILETIRNSAPETWDGIETRALIADWYIAEAYLVGASIRPRRERRYAQRQRAYNKALRRHPELLP